MKTNIFKPIFLVKFCSQPINLETTFDNYLFSQAMNIPSSLSVGLPSCTKTVTIRMNGQVIQLKQNHGVIVNNQEITKVPYSIHGIKIKSVSSIFLLGKSSIN